MPEGILWKLLGFKTVGLFLELFGSFPLLQCSDSHPQVQS